MSTRQQFIFSVTVIFDYQNNCFVHVTSETPEDGNTPFTTLLYQLSWQLLKYTRTGLSKDILESVLMISKLESLKSNLTQPSISVFFFFHKGSCLNTVLTDPIHCQSSSSVSSVSVASQLSLVLHPFPLSRILFFFFI